MTYRITRKEKRWALRAIVTGIAFYFISSPIKDWIDTMFNGNRLLVGIVLTIAILYIWNIE